MTEEGWYRIGRCKILVSKDDGLWHMSISRKDRLPSYDELKTARYQFMPDVLYVAQIFPPKDEFVNLHSFTLHLWELAGDVSYADKRPTLDREWKRLGDDGPA